MFIFMINYGELIRKNFAIIIGHFRKYNENGFKQFQDHVSSLSIPEKFET
jgi:hypothetical protein